jgi:hypothetical protein
MCAVVLVLVVGSAMAFADGINDPKIIIHGVSGDVACPEGGCTGVGSNFTFSVPPSGSGTLFFTNESGQNWSSLELIEKGEPAADIQCSSWLFSSCTVTTLKDGSVEILLSNPEGGPKWKDRGIQNGQSFAITFSCVNKSCWPGGLTFGGHGRANVAAVPEPGTIALMVTGLGAMVSRRKMWKSRGNS